MDNGGATASSSLTGYVIYLNKLSEHIELFHLILVATLYLSKIYLINVKFENKKP